MHRILIIDDERDITESVSELLKREGYETAVAYNGKEAIESLERQPADLVILDIQMPVMDGMQFMDTVRKEQRFDIKKIIVMSVYIDNKWQLLREGIADYIVKPFGKNALISSVKKALQNS